MLNELLEHAALGGSTPFAAVRALAAQPLIAATVVVGQHTATALGWADHGAALRVLARLVYATCKRSA